MHTIASSETHLCFLQKYVEQISQLANMCQQDATGAAAADLEILVSMRVSTTCSTCLVQLMPKALLLLRHLGHPSVKDALANIKAFACLLCTTCVGSHFASAVLVGAGGLMLTSCMSLRCVLLTCREIMRSGVPCFHATIGPSTAGTEKKWPQRVSLLLFPLGRLLW